MTCGLSAPRVPEICLWLSKLMARDILVVVYACQLLNSSHFKLGAMRSFRRRCSLHFEEIVGNSQMLTKYRHYEIPRVSSHGPLRI